MSGSVIKTVQKWYHDQGEHGAPPVIHQFALTSLAWLKKPAAVRGVKIHELAAFCIAALRPTRATWEKFLDNLRRLRVDGVISDDESVAIVASELTEPLLAQLDEEAEPDADTIAEAIDRVLTKYREEAQAAVEQAIMQARAETAIAHETATQEMARRAQVEHRIIARVNAIGRGFSSAIFLLAGLLVVASVVLAIPGVLETTGSQWKMVARGIVFIAALLGAYHTISGRSLRDLKNRFDAYIAGRIALLLYGTELLGSTSPGNPPQKA